MTTTQDDIDGLEDGMWCGNIKVDGVWQKLICIYSGSGINMALESDYAHSITFVSGGRTDGTRFTINNTVDGQSRFRIDAIEIFAAAKTA